MLKIIGIILVVIFAVWMIAILGCFAIVGYGEYLTRKDEKKNNENRTEIVVISRTEG